MQNKESLEKKQEDQLEVSQKKIDKKQPQQNSPKSQPLQQRQKNIEGITIFCGLCQNYICHSVTTICQHTFCQLCISEYLLMIDECPICLMKIRNQRCSSNILFDNLIIDYIKKFEPQDLKEYTQRFEQYKEYAKSRILQDVDAGTLVDIRDSEHVWCLGKVIRTLNKTTDRKIKYIIIKYDKSNKKQELPENSSRVAPRGTFTTREDIPKYERGKLIIRNTEENITYVIPKGDELYQDDIKKK